MPRGLDELQGKKPAVVEQPLLHEPGTQWEYGVSKPSKSNPVLKKDPQADFFSLLQARNRVGRYHG